MEAKNVKDFNAINNMEVQGIGPWRLAWMKFRKNKFSMFGAILFALILLSVILVPMFSTYTYRDFDVFNRMQSPNRDHLLGTDASGYDVFVRVFYGGRISLALSLIATVVLITMGTIVGCLSGYYGGRVDNILMRFTEFVSSIPVLPIIVSICGALAWLLAQSVQMYIIMFIFGLIKWPSLARMIRGQIISIRESEYMQAAEVLGLSTSSKIRKHLLPNILGIITVTAIFSIIEAILMEVTLSTLGFQFPYPTPTWGNMLPSIYSSASIGKYYWLWVPVGSMVTLTLVSINIIGEGLRDAFDPREEHR